METDEMDEIIDDIIRNALEFIVAEIALNFKTRKITPWKAMAQAMMTDQVKTLIRG